MEVEDKEGRGGGVFDSGVEVILGIDLNKRGHGGGHVSVYFRLSTGCNYPLLQDERECSRERAIGNKMFR